MGKNTVKFTKHIQDIERRQSRRYECYIVAVSFIGGGNGLPGENHEPVASNDVVIVKNGKRICGTGAALSNAPIAQDKAYFEVKIQSTGVWGVGLATKRCNVNVAPLGQDSESWVLTHDATMYHNKEQKGTLSQGLNEGDILGITYDHVHMNFYLNGQPLNCPFTGMKGTVYPVFYVDEGAVLDVQFDKFYHQLPDGFDSIMIEQSLL